MSSSVLDSKASSWLREIKQLSPAPANMSRHVWTWHWFFCISYQICKDWSLQEHQLEIQGQDRTMKVNWLINHGVEYRRLENLYYKDLIRCSCADLFNKRLDQIHKKSFIDSLSHSERVLGYQLLMLRSTWKLVLCQRCIRLELHLFWAKTCDVQSLICLSVVKLVLFSWHFVSYIKPT